MYAASSLRNVPQPSGRLPDHWPTEFNVFQVHLYVDVSLPYPALHEAVHVLPTAREVHPVRS